MACAAGTYSLLADGNYTMSLVVTEQEKPVLSTISRLDRERAISITGNVAPGHAQTEVMKEVQRMGRAQQAAVLQHGQKGLDQAPVERGIHL